MSSEIASAEDFTASPRVWLAEHMLAADPSAGYFFFTDSPSRTDEDDLERAQGTTASAHVCSALLRLVIADLRSGMN